MALNVSGTGSDADGKSMAALGAQQAAADHESAKDNGWKYDPEEMKQQIGDLQDLRNGKVAELLELSRDLADVSGLGDEEVSNGYLMAANDSGKSYRKLLKGIDEFLESYIEKIKDVDKAYMNEEQNAADQIKNMDI